MLRKSRKGFALVDLIMAISLFGILMVSYSYMNQAEKIKQTHIDRQRFLQVFDTALIKSFNEIIDTYADSLVPVSDRDTQWGWNKQRAVSPFPILSTVNRVPYLKFDLSSTNIGATSLNKLKSSILSFFSPVCKQGKVPGARDDLYLYCKDMRGFSYTTSVGVVSRPINPGQPIDPKDIPVATLNFEQKDGAGKGTGTIESYRISYGGAYQIRRIESANKLNEMRAAIESFTNATKMKEIANPENSDKSGGLNNADDEFVGWHWKAFGDKMSNISSTFCDKPAGGGSCTNLNKNDIWRSGTNIARGLIARRFVKNLLSDDKSFFIDGFGNGIYIYPTALQCTGTDYMACSINALTIPQDDYINIGTPPYLTVFYTEPFKLKADRGEAFGRVITAY